MKKKGITLMELIVVMAIITIGAVVLVPHIAGWLPHYRLRGAARDVVSIMRVAHIRAVANNVEYRVALNQPSNSYILRYQTAAGFKDEGSRQFLPSGITIDSVTFGGGTEVIFNPNSTASSGNLVLKHPKGGKKKIIVHRPTGRVRIE